MSVWLCIPSKRPPEQAEPVLAKWRAQGYKIALWRDMTDIVLSADLSAVSMNYPGYSHATNHLIREARAADTGADWFVIGGDDVEPDMNHTADEIETDLRFHFTARSEVNGEIMRSFGVMQPTGDRWGDSPSSRARFGEQRGAYIDRVCGSAWIGREFVERAYGGHGPLWPEYTHMYADEELQCVAEKLGVLWQRRDLIQLHRHWGRERGLASDMPEFLRKANGEMPKYKAIFEARRAAGFPGLGVLP